MATNKSLAKLVLGTALMAGSVGVANAAASTCGAGKGSKEAPAKCGGMKADSNTTAKCGAGKEKKVEMKCGAGKCGGSM